MLENQKFVTKIATDFDFVIFFISIYVYDLFTIFLFKAYFHSDYSKKWFIYLKIYICFDICIYQLSFMIMDKNVIEL